MVVIGEIFAGVRLSFHYISNITNAMYSPPPRHQAQFRFLEAVGKQGGGGFVHAVRGATCHLGAHRIEIDEPGLEQGLGDGFQGGIGFTQEGDAVVEGVYNGRNLILYM